MSRNLLAAIGVLILIALAGGFFFLQNNSNPQTPSPSPVTKVTPTPTASPTETPQNSSSPSGEVMMEEEKNEVSVTQSGFSPQTINIKAASKVTWTNNSGIPANVSSDSHPTHTLWSFLNLGTFSDRQSISVVFDEAGTYTYHNHLSPTQRGTVIVK
jgi:plastocyanin